MTLKRKSSKLELSYDMTGLKSLIVSLLSCEQSTVIYVLKSHFTNSVIKAAVVLLRSNW